jgi:eukaryotic-like serine/threonine-protein kinase
MPLSVGDKLGHYEILSPLGAGGMGEVYRAQDTQLQREVAIKVLPVGLAGDTDRLARFDREAKILAALNHPNIAVIYGLVESAGGRALVMELVAGETLADRIKRGPISLSEAVLVARQIAEALEAAHERGIVHRDLKPGNVMITQSGAVKVLDFGLAAMTQVGASTPGDPNNSPTLTIGITQAGVVMGTAGYMAPEQAAGTPVDRRADIWSYGVVLWEMLSGQRLFIGDTVAHTLAAVLQTPVDFDKLTAPAPIKNLVCRCLDRDVKNRLQWIGEARVVITKYLVDPALSATDSPTRAARLRYSRLPWIAAAVVALLAIGTLSWAFLRRPAADTQSLRYSLEAPPDTRFVNTYFNTAISPDGHFIAFGVNRKGSPDITIWLRPMDSLDARELPGTQGANGPFWSSDSKSIGFVAANKLKRVDVVGGTAQVLCDAPNYQGGTWGSDGTILFSANNVIQRVSAFGGAPAPVTALDSSLQETAHRFPSILPDGKSFLFTILSPNAQVQGVHVASLEAPKKRFRLASSDAKAAYAPPREGHAGYLLWLRELTLIAQRFDGKAHIEGDPVPLAEQVSKNSVNRAAFWISDNGVLVYRSGGETGYQILWADRDGKREVLTAPTTDTRIGDPRISPDGSRIAIERDTSQSGGQEFDVWTYEPARRVMTRLTFGQGRSQRPVWSPDGRQIAFSNDRTGTWQIYVKDVGGTGQEQLLTDGPNAKAAKDWSRDGRYILYEEQDPKNGADIRALLLDGDHKPIPVLQTPFNEAQPQFSPDGKWIAYQSDESGANQIYVQSFPPSGGKWQISTSGGTSPAGGATAKSFITTTLERFGQQVFEPWEDVSTPMRQRRCFQSLSSTDPHTSTM